MSYEKVLFVGIVVDYRFSEVAHSWKSVRFIAVIEAFDAGSILLANDVSKMHFAGKDIVEIPEIIGTFRDGMLEAFHRLGELSHEAANVVVELRASRCFPEDFAFQKSQHPNREAIDLGHCFTFLVGEG